MPSVKKPAVPEEKVHCSACGKEIPQSTAIVPHNKDYVLFYCSLRCEDQGESRKAKVESKGGRAKRT
jgi:hypothetical protein